MNKNSKKKAADGIKERRGEKNNKTLTKSHTRK